MLFINLNGGGKSHVLSQVSPSADGRVVTTVCGLVHPEVDFTGTEDGSNLCGRCFGKVDDEVLDTPTEDAVESSSDEDEAPVKSTSK